MAGRRKLLDHFALLQLAMESSLGRVSASAAEDIPPFQHQGPFLGAVGHPFAVAVLPLGAFQVEVAYLPFVGAYRAVGGSQDAEACLVEQAFLVVKACPIVGAFLDVADRAFRVLVDHYSFDSFEGLLDPCSDLAAFLALPALVAFQVV